MIGVRPVRALARPAWGVALGVLVLNDHMLKGAGILPGWLTGKLSDFAGLFVAGVLLAALTVARTPRRVAIAQVVVGAGFTAFKLVPVLSVAAEGVFALVGLSWRVVADPTDLLALPVLALAYVHTVRAGTSPATPARVVAGRALAVVGTLACVASEQGPSPVTQPAPCGGDGNDCDQDGVPAPLDCNDADPEIGRYSSGTAAGCPNPTGEDACDDGLDNDLDNKVDCQDPDCAFACADLESVCDDLADYDFASEGKLTGSTAFGTSVTEGSCVGADSPEVLFQGTSSRTGVLTVKVPEGHGVHARSTCDEAFTEIACADGATPGTILQWPVTAGVPLTIAVEAMDPLAAGVFELPIEVHPTGCGDGKREGEEQCDDGNWIAGDGCDGLCIAEPATYCDAAPTLQIGATDGDFAGAPHAFVGPCAGSFDTAERVYKYVATTTSLTLSVASTADVSLYANSGACPGAKAEGCVEKKGAGGGETLTLVTTPGEELTFFVELRTGEPETSTFTVTLSDP